MKRKGPQPEGYQGHEFERDLVRKGLTVTDPAYIDEYKTLYEHYLNSIERKRGEVAVAAEIKKAKERGLPFLPFDASVKLVKDNHPFDPTNPPDLFSSSLRNAVIEELDVPDSLTDEVRFYTATSSSKKSGRAYGSPQEIARDLTPLDYWHGVDFFMEIGGELVPLDATLRSKSPSNVVLIGELDIPSGQAEGSEINKFLDEVDSIAKDVVDRLSPETKARLSGERS